MKVTVTNKRRLGFVLRVYLSICSVFVKPFRLISKLGILVMPVLMGLILLLSSILYGSYKKESRVRGGYEFAKTYEFFSKRLPDTVFEGMDVICNAEGALISRSDVEAGNATLETKMTIRNNTSLDILLKSNGPYTFQFRSRFWTEAFKSTAPVGAISASIDFDGDIFLNPNEAYLIKLAAGETLTGKAVIHMAEGQVIPDKAKYWVIGLVQSKWKWANTQQCAFGVSDE